MNSCPHPKTSLVRLSGCACCGAVLCEDGQPASEMIKDPATDKAIVDADEKIRSITAAMAETVRERDELKHLAEVRAAGCQCGDDEACRFVRERDEAIEALKFAAIYVPRDVYELKLEALLAKLDGGK